MSDPAAKTAPIPAAAPKGRTTAGRPRDGQARGAAGAQALRRKVRGLPYREGAEALRPAAEQGRQAPAGPVPYRGELEQAFGTDLSGVRVHSGPQAKAATRKMGARAFASGQDIVMGEAPSKGLVAHEVAHTVQQRGGSRKVRPKASGAGPDTAVERQADRAAESVLAGQPVGPLTPDAPGQVRGSWLDDAADAVGGAADTVSGWVDEGVDTVKDVAQGAAETANEWVDEGVDTVKSAAKTANEWVDEGVETATDAAKSTAKKVGGWVDQGVETATDAAKSTAKKVGGWVDQGAKAAREWGKDVGVFGASTLTGAGGAGNDYEGGSEGASGDAPDPLEGLAPEEKFDYHVCRGDCDAAVGILIVNVAVDRGAVASIQYDPQLGVPAQASGELGKPQDIRIGPFALDLGYHFALSTLGHEVEHARQKSGVDDKPIKIASEREYLAYTWEALNDANPDLWTRHDAAVRSQKFWQMWEGGLVGREETEMSEKDEAYWAGKFLERHAGRQFRVEAILRDPRFQNATPTTTVCEAPGSDASTPENPTG